VQFSKEHQPKNRDLGLDFVFGAAFCLPLLSATRSVKIGQRGRVFSLGPPCFEELVSRFHALETTVTAKGRVAAERSMHQFETISTVPSEQIIDIIGYTYAKEDRGIG
jgi:hypothetical protein